MTSNPECDRARLAVMAWLDGEAGGRAAAEDRHVSTCQSCQAWLTDLTAMTAGLDGLEYPQPRIDVWPAVEEQIQRAGSPPLTRQLWPIVALLVAWRALQLSVDLPWPVLHPIVPLAVTLTALWRVFVDSLAIVTTAPELGKRGI